MTDSLMVLETIGPWHMGLNPGADSTVDSQSTMWLNALASTSEKQYESWADVIMPLPPVCIMVLIHSWVLGYPCYRVTHVCWERRTQCTLKIPTLFSRIDPNTLTVDGLLARIACTFITWTRLYDYYLI